MKKTFEIDEISEKLFFLIIVKNCFLKNVKTSICTAEKQYFCDYCLKTFFVSANLKKHKNSSQNFFLKER